MKPIGEALRLEMRQFRELSRLFFGRFLENDLISLDGDTRGTLVGVLALLAAPGLFIPFLEFVQYSSVPLCFMPLYARDLASLPDKVLHLALSMTVLGIVMVLEWDALLPDRRDTAVLRPLPIATRTLFAAKVGALVRFWLLFVLVQNGISMFFFPIAVVGRAPFAELVWFIRGHLLAVLAANGFMFLALIALQGTLLNVLGWRRYRQWAPYAQALLVAALLIFFFASLGLAHAIRPGRPLPDLVFALPPLWFVGAYQQLLGWQQAAFDSLARVAWWSLALALGTAAAAYAVSYRRSITQAYEQQEGPASAPGALLRLLHRVANRWWLRRPAERAAFHFVWNTVMRSRAHRVLVASYVGVGAALVFQELAGVIAAGKTGLWRNPHGPLLLAMPVVALFLLAGLRYAFSVPAELKANWLFQTSPDASPRDLLAGARRAVFALSVAPLAFAMLPTHAAIWGWQASALHIAYVSTIVWLLMEALMAPMEKLPFTCSFVAGKTNLKGTWPMYVCAYLAFVAVVYRLEVFLLADPARFFWFALAAAGAKAAIARWRGSRERDLQLLYDDMPEPAVRTLGLSQ